MRVNGKHKSGKLSIKSLIMIGTMLLSIVVGSIYSKSSSRDRELKENDIVVRNEYGKGDKQIDLQASINGVDNEISLSVDERLYSGAEIEDMYLSAAKMLEYEILGDNDSLLLVCNNLKLSNSVEKMPFYIRWKSSNEDVLDNRGNIMCRKDCEESHDILLTANLNYEDFSRNIEYEIRVIPKNISREERNLVELDAEIEKVLEISRYDEIIALPQVINGNEIVWKQKRDNTGILIMFFGLIAGGILGFAYEYDQRSKIKKIREKLQEVYPSFVENLKLYMISGMSVKKSFIKLYEHFIYCQSKDYDLLIAELQKVKNSFENGMKEEEVYSSFGESCGGSYKKLCFLLITNLKHGNNKILQLMDEEVKRSFVTKKDIAARRADEALVKLLFPMMLMLVVVMLLIMLPVYIGFKS